MSEKESMCEREKERARAREKGRDGGRERERKREREESEIEIDKRESTSVFRKERGSLRLSLDKEEKRGMHIGIDKNQIPGSRRA